VGNNKPKTNRAGNTDKVSQMDVCQTPPHALEPLYPYLHKDWNIWESAAGPEQLLVKALHSNGFTVIATDLLYSEEYNFFEYYPRELKWDIQITNVPFSIKYKWLERSFELGKRFALLVPYETTAAAEFKKLFKQYNNKPYRIEKLSPERRINFKMPNLGWGVTVYDEVKGKMVKKGDSAQMPTCWLTWGLDVYKTRDDILYEFDIPMRLVRYNDNNEERQ
jgi:hypothetical protein